MLAIERRPPQPGGPDAHDREPLADDGLPHAGALHHQLAAGPGAVDGLLEPAVDLAAGGVPHPAGRAGGRDRGGRERELGGQGQQRDQGGAAPPVRADPVWGRRYWHLVPPFRALGSMVPIEAEWP